MSFIPTPMPWPLLLGETAFRPPEASRDAGTSPTSVKDAITPVRIVRPPLARVTPASADPAARASAWQRIVENRGVQRALAIGKLAADCLDFVGALLVSPITGTAILDVVLKNFKTDTHQLVQGKSPAPEASRLGGPPGAGANAGAQLATSLGAAVRTFKRGEPYKNEKVAALKSTARWRGLTFALSLFAVGTSGALAAVNPALGGALLGLSVYAARQAYANWRLARENLDNVREDRSMSPMGASALGHALLQAYQADPWLGATPDDMQTRAGRAAAAVSAVSAAATVAVGGVATAASVALPAALTYARHGARLIGSAVAPIVDARSTYASEDEISDLAASAPDPRSRTFDEDAKAAWVKFLREDKRRVAAYREALAHHENYGRPVLPRPRCVYVPLPSMTPAGRAESVLVDIGPLLRWARETRQLDQLPHWIQQDAVRPAQDRPLHGERWAERLLLDLEAIDGARVARRGASVLGGVVSAASSVVSLAV